MTTIIECADCPESFEWQGNPAVAGDVAATNGWQELDEDGNWLCETCARRRRISYAEQADCDLV